MIGIHSLRAHMLATAAVTLPALNDTERQTLHCIVGGMVNYTLSPYAYFAATLPTHRAPRAPRDVRMEPALGMGYGNAVRQFGKTAYIAAFVAALKTGGRLVQQYSKREIRPAHTVDTRQMLEAYYKRPASRAMRTAFENLTQADYAAIEERVLSNTAWERYGDPSIRGTVNGQRADVTASPPTGHARRICRICDGVPGNDGACLCGFKRYGA